MSEKTMRGVYFSGETKEVVIKDYPIPQIGPAQALVKVECSLISAGTETFMIDSAAKDGRNLTNLGYQAVGSIVEKGPEVPYDVGTRVAVYGGPYVAHHEYLAVPRNLMVPLKPETVSEEAAFVGLGAISIHGLRAAKLEFGESCWVIGLGTIGQLTAQIAVNAGYQVIATDFDEKKIELAKKAGVDLAGHAKEIGADAIKSFLGQGVDAVVMTAGSSSESLVNETLKALRPGGRYIMVGVSPLNINRGIMFQLESEVMVTRAGGPGRYDRQYELHGTDYPLQYVRWTEGRNMQEFIRLLEKGRISTKELITHRYHFEDAAKAYEMIQSGKEEYIGVILTY